MNSFRKKKVETVAEIEGFLKNSSSLAIVEYRGLTVEELQNLRQEFKSAGVLSKIYKNRLFKIAAENNGYSDLKSDLVGPNLFAFGTTDPIAPAKIIAKKAKEQPLLILKGGIYEKTVVSAAENIIISSLPNYTEALTMLASALQSPLKKLVFSLKLLIDKQKITA
ncbi:50S ribosomal protein L10 [Mycoplasma flocculare]|uniref:Large ribosomal subunit protein uL10 n=2 Tax=Mesomycoplasma flocculare TaxID=2128 RepID=A0A0A8E7B1_MESFC|nr:50S ribosomal protein L10 [Mesomycoplasma flocculare]MXR39703.1 50S ribosomal protein L10 [Mycoplasma sp. MF12]AJC50080.1 50S ribosomal protein L10 [Mesomycoplasma flocculare ATCC 27399]ENX51045.1 50S ribosomal protein L10 [Mesomycoplasma flocculare ATCC 27716]MXR06162.1 50S ribosomal protein L10 [Mesomycoplasma flocculare]MXR12513.1 50S ribosomal protein L10 [Mesomycoplasma flocculare]